MKFSKIFDFGQNFRKFWNFWKISKNFDFSEENIDVGQNFRKILIFSKILKNFDCSKIFEEISIFLEIYSKFGIFFSKIPKNSKFSQNFKKISTLVQILEIFQFLPKFRKICFYVKFSKKKPRIWHIFAKFDFFSKIWLRRIIKILGKFSKKKIDFGQSFQKMSTFFFEKKKDFSQTLKKIDFVHICRKFWKISI